MSQRASARAHANIALVKYWGKRDPALNLPTTGSLSLTLDALYSETTVELDESLAKDELVLNDVPQTGPARERVSCFLDLVRTEAGLGTRARVLSRNTFPTASGLASSASAFAALALAATRAANLFFSQQDLSVLARRGSGSAARSIYGGFVEMKRGKDRHGRDACAVPLVGEREWDLRLVVAIVAGGPKKAVSSTSGMEHTQATSPLYLAFLAAHDADLAAARVAVKKHDLDVLGEIAEHNALAMHATALAARPSLLYFRGATVEAILAIQALRAQGAKAFVTVDAGPHVKVLCAPTDVDKVERTLKSVAGVTETIVCRPGPEARLLP